VRIFNRPLANFYSKIDPATPVEFTSRQSKASDYALHQNSNTGLSDGLSTSYSGGLDAGELNEKLFGESIEIEKPKEAIVESDNTLVQLINKMIMDAHEDGVSDIHIESYPDQQNTRVRFSKDAP